MAQYAADIAKALEKVDNYLDAIDFATNQLPPTPPGMAVVLGVKGGKVVVKVTQTVAHVDDAIDVTKGAGKVDNVLSQMYKDISLGKGSTGRTVPNSLNEQIAMKEVLSNPLNGAKELKSVTMNDTRWPVEDGWVKMSKNVNGIEIHFVHNTKTGALDDFKFK